MACAIGCGLAAGAASKGFLILGDLPEQVSHFGNRLKSICSYPSLKGTALYVSHVAQLSFHLLSQICFGIAMGVGTATIFSTGASVSLLVANISEPIILSVLFSAVSAAFFQAEDRVRGRLPGAL